MDGHARLYYIGCIGGTFRKIVLHSDCSFIRTEHSVIHWTFSSADDIAGVGLGLARRIVLGVTRRVLVG